MGMEKERQDSSGPKRIVGSKRSNYINDGER